MRTTEEYLAECMERGEIPQAIAFLSYKGERDRLSKIPDPSVIRRKAPEYTGDELCLFEYAVEGFLKGKMESETILDILIKDAFAKKESRTFEIIQKACEFAKTPLQIKHGKNVIAAIDATITFLEKERRFPTKFEVKQAVNLAMGDRAFGLSDSTSWTKVFTDACLRFLPKDTPWAEQRSD